MGTFENFWSKASDMLCAGSVEMINTDSRALASCTAKLQLKQKHDCQIHGVEHWYGSFSIYLPQTLSETEVAFFKLISSMKSLLYIHKFFIFYSHNVALCSKTVVQIKWMYFVNWSLSFFFNYSRSFLVTLSTYSTRWRDIMSWSIPQNTCFT